MHNHILTETTTLSGIQELHHSLAQWNISELLRHHVPNGLVVRSRQVHQLTLGTEVEYT